MYDLIDFLIEERYCNSELEAVKILESVSDGFYEYLLEEYDISKFAPERVRAIKDKIKALKKQAQENPLSIKDPKKFRKRIQMLQGSLDGPVDNQSKIAEREKRRRIEAGEVKQNKGGLPTPRGRGGSRFQKPRDVIGTGSLPGIEKDSHYVLDKKAKELSGGMPSGSQSSSSVPNPKTAEITGGRHGTVHGGRGTQRDRTTGGVVGVKRP